MKTRYVKVILAIFIILALLWLVKMLYIDPGSDKPGTDKITKTDSRAFMIHSRTYTYAHGITA